MPVPGPLYLFFDSFARNLPSAEAAPYTRPFFRTLTPSPLIKRLGDPFRRPFWLFCGRGSPVLMRRSHTLSS